MTLQFNADQAELLDQILEFIADADRDYLDADQADIAHSIQEQLEGQM